MKIELEMKDAAPVDPLTTKMCTVTCDYSATGEGVTYIVMYTRGYGHHEDRRQNALGRFTEKYGTFFAAGATVHEGMVFDFPGSHFLVSEKLKETLLDFVRDAGGLEYDASFTFNFC